MVKIESLNAKKNLGFLTSQRVPRRTTLGGQDWHEVVEWSKLDVIKFNCGGGDEGTPKYQNQAANY